MEGGGVKNKLILRSLTVLISTFLLTGCEMKAPIIKEMESAYLVVDKQKNDTHLERDAAVSRAVQKYIPLGMKAEDVLKILNDLQKQGFEIMELKYEGTKIWPNKEFRHYSNVNREKNYPHGTTGYIAEKEYDKTKIIITKTAFISIKLDSNGMVIESKGSIVGDGL